MAKAMSATPAWGYPAVGLGPTITKAIVTAYRGRMSIASEESVGTSFTVRIPLEGRDSSEF